MSFGLMRHTIKIYAPGHATDTAGFHTDTPILKATVRAAVEHRHATSAWVNRASFYKATAMFRFRLHPEWRVDERDLIKHDGRTYFIDSVEIIGNRYVEVLAHHTTPEGEGRDG
ncbi:head-tail adaptor protein [Corynebacterium kozikiae]|uniref:head-tail adaptor protein n=1 Tax=Corynebacterium kozikiae TaxID=2968469 RepID=UPI00211D0219|nr:head-tail adaptor protein [Corynebacterium sp. 76QC2CO]MCI6574744.1 head-tail adaptor protein [Arcanobacterium sp.]MCQ9343815.1 head-tail adaptor protein [Corynebacterium sp. 76QC2CO]MDY5854451.1 head-tail adaptor protein [Arcanobacterium sp.]